MLTRDSSGNVSLDYALFNPSADVIDPNTGLVYTNMFDAQMDAIFFALMALNFRTLKVMVTESGWPNKGTAKETAATPDNAQSYNTNLIRHVINNTGTPAKPGEEIDVYIFSLFNENRKPGLQSERNWGLFYPDQTTIYSLDLTGKGDINVVTGANITTSNGTWCVASSSASEQVLKNALDWACGPGNVDCSAIQPSQPCFQPDSLPSHASYAFNSYYQQNGANDVSCSFGGAGIKTTKDPMGQSRMKIVMEDWSGLWIKFQGCWRLSYCLNPDAMRLSQLWVVTEKRDISICRFHNENGSNGWAAGVGVEVEMREL
ncbi:Glucan endo-1,3-beta-glucosidase 13 [Platanthera guangdongensis]|uniref:Glucan endo-1,3-beta-glucosidase 13 n=1 Tax=Platanthera guangdongensis TaxID=2320717 RepID=A0ABR2M2L2_9ASPA